MSDPFRDILVSKVRKQHPDWTEDMVEQWMADHHDRPEREKRERAQAMLDQAVAQRRAFRDKQRRQTDELITDLARFDRTSGRPAARP